MWAALAVDQHGHGLALVTGTERQMLLAVRTRWLGVPVDRLPFAIETEGVNGRRVNPARVPVRAEIAHAGGGRWLGLMLAEDGQIVEAIWTDSKAQLLELLQHRWPHVPVKVVPHVRENPGIPRRAEISYSGAGTFTVLVSDSEGRELERIQADSLKELLALLAERYPDLPVRVVPRRNPAGGKAGRKEAAMVTDRALRYRANADPPPGPRICALCGSTRNVEIGHANGREEDNSPENKIWTCRTCNTRCGNTLRAAGIGRLTRQLNPATEGAASLGQWLTAVLSMRGESGAMPVAQAVALIRGTSPEDRSAFAHEIWRLRRARYGPTGRSDTPPF